MQVNVFKRWKGKTGQDLKTEEESFLKLAEGHLSGIATRALGPEVPKGFSEVFGPLGKQYNLFHIRD